MKRGEGKKASRKVGEEKYLPKNPSPGLLLLAMPAS